MRRTLLPALLALLILASHAGSAPVDLQGKTLKQVFDELLPKLDRDVEQQKWQKLCLQLGAPGNEALRAEACQLMCVKLTPETPTAARLWLLQQLQLIGREESVAAVAAQVTDKDPLVRDAAVRCLANNPAPAATARLVAGLTTTTGPDRIALLNALGHRADRAAVSALAENLANKETAVAVAAARALGRIADPEATKAIAGVRPTSTGAVRAALNDAWLAHGDRLLKVGRLADALALYREVNKPEESRPVRLAALRGVLAAAGDAAGTMVLDLFAKGSPDERAIAVSQIENLNPGALRILAGSIDKLPLPSQVQVLTGLGTRGEKSQAGVALTAAKSANEAVRRAGIQALGALGDASATPILLETLGIPALSEVTADSLVQLGGEGVDAKLVTALEAETVAGRFVALVGVLERRKTTTAIPFLLKTARGDNPALRTAALAGLRGLAEPRHAADLVLALLKAEKGKERDHAEQVLVAVCGQIPDAERRADAVLAVLDGGSKGDLVILLPVLGRLGGDRARKLVTTALASTDAAEYAAGFTALCNWPTSTVGGDLLKLAESAKEPTQRQQALRALIRVESSIGDPNPERLPLLKKAMLVADRDEDRRLALEAVGTVRTIESLRYAVGYLDRKELEQAACKAIVELAHSRMLREPNRAEFVKALDRVIALCKDKGLVDRARQYKQ